MGNQPKIKIGDCDKPDKNYNKKDIEQHLYPYFSLFTDLRQYAIFCAYKGILASNFNLCRKKPEEKNK